MLGFASFYFGLLRRYIILMASMFDQINVPRYATDGVTISELIKVPVLVASRDKTLARLFGDPNITRMQALTMPRISFELTDATYDKERKQNTVESITIQDTANTNIYFRQYVPVPYDLHFSAYVYTNTQEDGAKIVEQIVPFFAPDFAVRAQLVEEMNIEQNIVINLDRVEGPQDNYADEKMLDRRAVIWTLDFTLKGWFYGPIYDIGLIKFIEMHFVPVPSIINTYANTEVAGNNQILSVNAYVHDTITLQPGLLANGSPTTNAAASIPYQQITLGEDWGDAFVMIGDVAANGKTD